MWTKHGARQFYRHSEIPSVLLSPERKYSLHTSQPGHTRELTACEGHLRILTRKLIRRNIRRLIPQVKFEGGDFFFSSENLLLFYLLRSIVDRALRKKVCHRSKGKQPQEPNQESRCGGNCGRGAGPRFFGTCPSSHFPGYPPPSSRSPPPPLHRAFLLLSLPLTSRFLLTSNLFSCSPLPAPPPSFHHIPATEVRGGGRTFCPSKVSLDEPWFFSFQGFSE